jgi:prepilin-type N-terminal cleavage/methylation domain-containing protein
MTSARRIHRRLGQERGFTLIELLAAMSVGAVIIGVAFGLLDSVVRTFGSSGQRVDVAQRGRLAIDTLTAQLRSQVCAGDPVNGFVTSIVSGTKDKVVFYSNIGDGRGTILRGLEYANGAITEYEYPYSKPAVIGVPTRTRQIVSNVVGTNPTPNGNGLFRYFSYDPAAANLATSPAPDPYRPLAATLGAADLQQVVRITVRYTAYPENGSPSDKTAADFSGDFVSRTAASPYEFRTPPLPEATALEPRCK